MPGTEPFSQTLAEYLTLRIGQASLSPMGTVILALTLAAALLSAYHLWRIGRQEDRRDRLMELRGPVVDRAVREQRPRWYQRIGSIIAASPAVGTAEQERLLRVLAAAGVRGHGSLAGFVASKLCSAFITAALVWLFLEWRQWFAGSTTIRIAVLLGALMLGWRLPDFLLSRLAARRKLRVEQGLPDALDLLVICVDAGLGFDAALARVTDKYKNALSELLAKALREVSLGRPRLEALDEMGRNSGVEDLHNFIQAVIQSEQFGTGIGKILRIQADEMRRKRRQRAQERGAQATLKMMLPMVGCIFPTLWIVLLGPAVLILMRPR
jgi:tight adherence protein C